MIFRRLLPKLSDDNDTLRWDLVDELLARYSETIVAVSDEQAPALYIFLTACLLEGKKSVAEHCLNLHFASFAERSGKVTRPHTDGPTALKYLFHLLNDGRAGAWQPANPSQLLAVFLLLAGKLGLGADWDLRALDRKYSAFFIPTNYRSFGGKVIEEGINHTQQMGFGIWTLKQFAAEFERATNVSLTEHRQNSALPRQVFASLR